MSPVSSSHTVQHVLGYSSSGQKLTLSGKQAGGAFEYALTRHPRRHDEQPVTLDGLTAANLIAAVKAIEESGK